MNIPFVDFLILFLGIGALLRGYQIGFLRQFVSTVAFIMGLFPGSWVSAYAMDHVNGPSKPLAVCFLFMTVGELIAVKAKVAVKNQAIQTIDNYLGAAISVITLLVGLWLASAIFTLAPPSSVQAHIKNSGILSSLNQRLPSPNRVLQSLNTLIDPNQSPAVFAGREPAPEANKTLPDPQQYAEILTKARASVVKLEGLGCGGIVDGSGFVFARELIATNAHVVAGVSSPKVFYDGKAYNTTVTLFDPANDLAVLRVPGLPAGILTINRMRAADGSAAFALGYPGGGDYAISPGVVLDTFEALGQDIYGKERVIREVYSIQTTIVRGNSGGPVIASDGTVIGVVFATSTAYNNIGYALTMEQVHERLHEAQTKSVAVSTGQCSE